MLTKLAAGAGAAPKLYIDDCFQVRTRTGTRANATITTVFQPDFVWLKSRNDTYDHFLYDTIRGATNHLQSDTTSAQGTYADSLTAFSATGYSLGANVQMNANATTYVDWVWKKAPKFFDVQTATLSSGNATVSFANLATLGMVIVKRTDSTGSWYVWHRSLTAGKLLYLEQTAAEATLGHITVSGTTLTLVDGTLADGDYVCYGFAHDTSTDGIIQCGSFTTDGSGIGSATLNWEPQLVLLKPSSTTVDWQMIDSMRGFTAAPNASNQILNPNLSIVEFNQAGGIYPTATGFASVNAGLSGGQTYIYLAIRRPNKPPTSGTQVYNAVARTGTGAAATVTGVGFAPDLVQIFDRGNGGYHATWDRLRGTAPVIYTNSTSSENSTYTDMVTGFDVMDGIRLGVDANQWFVNHSTYTYINHFFRRAPGVMDNLCDTGSGANKTESHNLAAIPELWLRKGRSGTTEWVWGSSLLANTQKIVMPSPNGVVTDATAWNSTYPTATSFSVGTAAAVNTSSATYTTYLWATKPGISKVFTYTGDGGSAKVIDCGFTAGARFVMIIRTTASTAQDIFIWDSVRGIVSGNDPHLSLNTTAAEVTTDDSVDPDNSGFAINEVAATHINVNGAVYIGVAYA